MKRNMEYIKKLEGKKKDNNFGKDSFILLKNENKYKDKKSSSYPQQNSVLKSNDLKPSIHKSNSSRNKLIKKNESNQSFSNREIKNKKTSNSVKKNINNIKKESKTKNITKENKIDNKP